MVKISHAFPAEARSAVMESKTVTTNPLLGLYVQLSLTGANLVPYTKISITFPTKAGAAVMESSTVMTNPLVG